IALKYWPPPYGRAPFEPRRRSPQWASRRIGGRFPCPCGGSSASGWIGCRSVVRGSEEHTAELQALMSITYDVLHLNKQKHELDIKQTIYHHTDKQEQ